MHFFAFLFVLRRKTTVFRVKTKHKMIPLWPKKCFYVFRPSATKSWWPSESSSGWGWAKRGEGSDVWGWACGGSAVGGGGSGVTLSHDSITKSRDGRGRLAFESAYSCWFSSVRCECFTSEICNRSPLSWLSGQTFSCKTREEQLCRKAGRLEESGKHSRSEVNCAEMNFVGKRACCVLSGSEEQPGVCEGAEVAIRGSGAELRHQLPRRAHLLVRLRTQAQVRVLVCNTHKTRAHWGGGSGPEPSTLEI